MFAWLKRFLERLAAENEKEYKGKRLSYNDLNKQQKDDKAEKENK